MFSAEPFWKAISGERSVGWLRLSSYAEVWNTQLTGSFVQSAVRRFVRSLSDVFGTWLRLFQVAEHLDRLKEELWLFRDPKSKNTPYEENSVCSFAFIRKYLGLKNLNERLCTGCHIYYTLLSYKLLFGFLGWEYLFSRCQLITNISTFKQFETLSKCFKEAAPNRILRQWNTIYSLSQYLEALMWYYNHI